METIPERLDAQAAQLDGATALEPSALQQLPARVELDLVAPDTAAIDEPLVRRRWRGAERSRTRIRSLSATRQDVVGVLAVYFGTRGVLLLTAYLQASFGHYRFLNDLANWDGLWYREVANHGYLNHLSYGQTTLGFFPLYPLSMRTLRPLFSVLTGHGTIWSATVAGLVISEIGGAIATYLVYRLATEWWDRRVGFRAAILFALFPGSVVFSMVYSEGLLLPLALGCLLALGQRRWLLAGILAGFATAVQPVGAVLIPVCAIAAGLELRRRGWHRRALRDVIVAPLLSLTGIGAFALYLWQRTGTPLANYEAQHHGWSEKTDLLAMLHLVTRLWAEVWHTHPNVRPVDMNLIVGLVGGILLAGMLVLVVRQRHRITPAAVLWTFGVAFLALTSEYVPPNPRLLITAFPALMAVAYYARGKWWTALLWGNGILLVVLSVLTFHGVTLRP